MKRVNITSADIVKCMDNNQKDWLTKKCLADGIEPEPLLDTMSKITTAAVNCCIDLVNVYFESPAGKEYLNMRKKIEYIGPKL